MFGLIEYFPQDLHSILTWTTTIISIVVVFLLTNKITNRLLSFIRFISNSQQNVLSIILSLVASYLTFRYFEQEFSLELSTVVILIFIGAITISSQNLIFNIISGFITQSRQLFSLGDFIQIADISGKVIDWDLFTLQIETVDQSKVYISWLNVFNSNIINNSVIPFAPVEAIIHIAGDFVLRDAYNTIEDVCLEYQYEVTNLLDKTLTEQFESMVIRYPYVAYREIAGSSMIFSAFVIVNDQDDRLLDLHHSRLLLNIVIKLQEKGFTVGQVNDNTVINSGYITVE